MIGKIRYLVERKNIKENEILCILFTNEACTNLEMNIKKNYNYNINVYTFHKLSLEILKDMKYKITEMDTLRYIVDEYFYFIKYDNSMKLRVKKVLFKIDSSYNSILESKELEQLKKLIITFIDLFKTNNYKLLDFLKFKKNKDLIRIIIDIYLIYQEELMSTSSIDFNDMIIKATEYIKKNNIHRYKYIIVDEYQDTSYIRYLLLREIINKAKAKIVCVGDDYQSIYGFNGCDLSIFLNFKKYFGYSKILKISNTYRNSQELINVAGSFIMRNKSQMLKKLKSNKHIDKPIKIMYGNNLTSLLDKVSINHKNILILGRNNFDIYNYLKLGNNKRIKYKDLNIKYMTIHASKGLEEECVVIINLKDDIVGLPSKIKTDGILKLLNRHIETYPYEEERRLFYVAMTRTKSDLYLLVDKKNPSIFVRELEKYNKRYIEYI